MSSYAASFRVSTIQWVVLIGLLSVGQVAQAAPQPPNFSGGGFTIGLQYGPGLWNVDRALISKQTSTFAADTFANDAVTSHALTLRLAYSILGHVSIGVDFTATGWDLEKASRGGAGFLVGSATWHPLELVFMKKEKRPIPLDVGVLLGMGYGIAGEQIGMDGAVFQMGLLVDYFIARFFAVGLAFRTNFLLWDNLYYDFYNRDLPGAMAKLPQGSGGQQFHLALTLTFRAGD